MAIWIQQQTVREAKEKMYQKTGDERILWLNPFELVNFIAGEAKDKNLEIDEISSKFRLRPREYSVDEMVRLYKMFNFWGEKIDRKLALRILTKPEDSPILKSVKYIWDVYYKKRTKAPLTGILTLDAWAKKYSGNIGKYYRRFTIPKKDGSKRVIEAPLDNLSEVQKTILENILYSCYPMTRANPAHGFVRRRNILSNARIHVNSQVIVNLDIQNAFITTTESILRPKLEEYFTKKGADLLIGLCCLKGRLPQGAPASPMLLNFALLEMDQKLKTMATGMGWRYSRYADDLTFSCEKFNEKTVGIGRLIKKVSEEVVEGVGYKINKEKIRVFHPQRAMKVTGLVLNSGQPTISRKIRRVIRAKVHNLIIKGNGELKEVLGQIGFISLAHKDYAIKLRKRLDASR